MLPDYDTKPRRRVTVSSPCRRLPSYQDNSVPSCREDIIVDTTTRMIFAFYSDIYWLNRLLAQTMRVLLVYVHVSYAVVYVDMLALLHAGHPLHECAQTYR